MLLSFSHSSIGRRREWSPVEKSSSVNLRAGRVSAPNSVRPPICSPFSFLSLSLSFSSIARALVRSQQQSQRSFFLVESGSRKNTESFTFLRDLRQSYRNKYLTKSSGNGLNFLAAKCHLSIWPRTTKSDPTTRRKSHLETFYRENTFMQKRSHLTLLFFPMTSSALAAMAAALSAF